MKKIVFLFILNLQISCNPIDCFESTGNIVQEEMIVSPFDKITVGKEVNLILKQGPNQKVIIETGENLIDLVSTQVIDHKLILTDENSCNYTRDYAVTNIYVTAPNIIELRSDTARTIKSDGILHYNDITLYSENFHEDVLNIGDFELNIDSQNLRIISNGNSVFTIRGNVNSLAISFVAGSTSRFNGKDLLANTISIFQKSSNDMIINPLQNLTGTIFANGDVLSYNHPTNVSVLENYTGKLIYK